METKYQKEKHGLHIADFSNRDVENQKTLSRKCKGWLDTFAFKFDPLPLRGGSRWKVSLS